MHAVISPRAQGCINLAQGSSTKPSGLPCNATINQRPQCPQLRVPQPSLDDCKHCEVPERIAAMAAMAPLRSRFLLTRPVASLRGSRVKLR